MRHWWVSWPMAATVAFTVLNVEVVLIPALVASGISGLALFICTAVAASGEVCYWYWFVGWLGRQAPFIPAVRTGVQDFRGQGLLGQVRNQIEWGAALAAQVWAWFVGRVREQMDASSPVPRWLLARTLSIIRTSPIWMMYPVMIGLGLCPLGWIPGILICRKHRVRGAFTTLLAFNALKTYGVGLGWTAILHQVWRLF